MVWLERVRSDASNRDTMADDLLSSRSVDIGLLQFDRNPFVLQFREGYLSGYSFAERQVRRAEEIAEQNLLVRMGSLSVVRGFCLPGMLSEAEHNTISWRVKPDREAAKAKKLWGLYT
jgi:hypothetical protein